MVGVKDVPVIIWNKLFNGRVNPFSPSSITWEELEQMDSEKAAEKARKIIWQGMIPATAILILSALILFVSLDRIIVWILKFLITKGVIW